MSLVSLKSVLEYAEKNKIAIGSFSVGNMEMVAGAIEAAEQADTPIIIQIAEPRLKFSPLPLMGAMMTEGAKRAGVPVCVHFDHGNTEENIRLALELGFTSVMFDGSRFCLEENIEKTLRIRELADKFGADLEGEIGCLGKSEDGKDEGKSNYTNPLEAKEFAKKTRVDALAVAIGNAHGNYVGIPKLRFDILEEIANTVSVPLVLHGGTGISPDDFVKARKMGVRKINIATASFDACARAAKDNPEDGYFEISKKMRDNVIENVSRHINIFNK